MLTRIEIDGFKTFKKFSLDVPPFMVILGRNASGKSNLFDAISLISSTADRSLMEAIVGTRGESHELPHAPVERSNPAVMQFAVEVLLDAEARDDFGDVAVVRHSRLRYELSLALRPTGGPNGDSESAPARLYVEEESVRLIRRGDDEWIFRYGGNSQQRKQFVSYSSRAGDRFLETDEDPRGRRAFVIHQDGRAGRERYLPAAEAAATVLSTLTTANDYPHLFALKKELESWRMLQLDPAALRSVNSFDDGEFLAPNGANLANTLKRISQRTSSLDRPDGVLADLSNDLAAVVPEVVHVDVADDRARRQRQIYVRTRDDEPYSAGVASDGTLRALALLVALYDPERRGLICFEEPENGIYPQRLVDFLRHLRALVDESVEARRQNGAVPLRQLLLSSHSPVILSAIPFESTGRPVRDDVAFFDSATLIIEGARSRISRIRKVRNAAQTAAFTKDELRGSVAPAEIDAFQVIERLGTP